jgi:hypothetical protein
MKRIILCLLLLTPARIAAQIGQHIEVDTARVSAAAYAERSEGTRASGRFGIDLVRTLPNLGILSTSLSLVNDRANFHPGTGFIRWENLPSQETTSIVTAGAFMYQPQIFENRAGNVYVPSALMRGVESRWGAGRLAVNAFAGTYLVEQGSRLLYMKATSDRITGATATLAVSRALKFGFQAARTSSDLSDGNVIRSSYVPAASVQLRQAMEWKPSKWLTFNGEYGVAKAQGKTAPSYHVALEHESSRLSVRTAYVRRSPKYLPFGLLSFSSDRQGPYAEARYRFTNWLDVSASATELRTNLEKRSDLPTAISRQYNGNMSIRLPGNLQLSMGRSVSRLKLSGNSVYSGHTMILDSVTLTNAIGRWITRARLDEITMNSTAKTRTRGLEIEETRIFQHGLSLSGQVRLQQSNETDKRALRVSTAIRGGYSFGNRFSVNLQTDLGRDIRNETLFATTNLRTSTASLNVRLSASSDLRFEYYGTRMNYELNPESILASTLLGNSVSPVLGHSDRNVFFVQFQKTIRWGQAAANEFGSSSTGISIARPRGWVTGRVFVDENEDGIWNEGEPGASKVTVVLNDLRQTVTDENGHYEFAEAPVGPGEVALKADTLSAVFTPVTLQHPIDVPYKARTEANFVVTASSSIAGRIVEKKGDSLTPVADAAIRLEPSGLYAYTDAAGRFSISNVPRGQYELSVVPETVEESFQVLSGPVEPLMIAQAGQQLKGIDFVLEPVMKPAPVIERLPTSRVVVGK